MLTDILWEEIAAALNNRIATSQTIIYFYFLLSFTFFFSLSFFQSSTLIFFNLLKLPFPFLLLLIRFLYLRLNNSLINIFFDLIFILQVFWGVA